MAPLNHLLGTSPVTTNWVERRTLVLERGLEPLQFSLLDPKSSVSTFSTTPAYGAGEGSRTPIHSLEGCCIGRYTTPADPPTRIALEPVDTGQVFTVYPIYNFERRHRDGLYPVPWSKCGDSNPRPPAPKAGVLPIELHLGMVGLQGFEPRTRRL